MEGLFCRVHSMACQLAWADFEGYRKMTKGSKEGWLTANVWQWGLYHSTALQKHFLQMCKFFYIIRYSSVKWSVTFNLDPQYSNPLEQTLLWNWESVLKLVPHTLLHDQMILLYNQTFFEHLWSCPAKVMKMKNVRITIKNAVYQTLLSVRMDTEELEKEGDKILEIAISYVQDGTYPPDLSKDRKSCKKTCCCIVCA